MAASAPLHSAAAAHTMQQNSMHHHHHQQQHHNMLHNGGHQESTNYMMTTQPSTAAHPHHQIPQQQQLKAHCSQHQQPWGAEIVHSIPEDPTRGYYKSEDTSRSQQQQQQDANVQYKYNGNLVRDVSFNVGIEVESCVNAGSFTNVHYGSRPPISMDGINPAAPAVVGDHTFAPHEELRSREDSLDLYSTFREDSYSENSDDFSNESGDAANRFQPSISGGPMHNQVFQGQQQAQHSTNVYPESDYFSVPPNQFHHGHNPSTNQIPYQPSYARQQHGPQQGFPMGSMATPEDMYGGKAPDFMNGYHGHDHGNVQSSCIYTSSSQPQLHMNVTTQQQSMCQQMPSSQPPPQQQHVNPMVFHHQGGTSNLLDGATGAHMLPSYADINPLGQYGKMDQHYGTTADMSQGEVLLNGAADHGNKSHHQQQQHNHHHHHHSKPFQQHQQMNTRPTVEDASNKESAEGEKSSSDEDGLSENFGEIIKKTMVETVSA